jgi:hypothetical protein
MPLKGIFTLVSRKFQMLIIMVIDNKGILIKIENSSMFCSLKPNIWVSCSSAPSVCEHISPSINHKTIFQSAEIHIFVGETRRSHICSHHVSGSGHVPGQPDRISRAEQDGVMFSLWEASQGGRVVTSLEK